MVYNLIYSDGKSGKGFVKRFTMPGVIRDKEYDLTQGHPNSRIHYVSGNPNGEAEVVEVKLSQSSTARKKVFEYDFAELEIKGKGSRGNTLTKYPIRKVDFVKAGTSTLSKLDLWYDADSGRLNKEKRGHYIGKFDGDDQIITFLRNGSYKITGYDVSNRYDPEKTLAVEKFNPKKPISAIYIDGESKQYMVKRFMIETSTADKEFGFISESIGSRLVLVTTSETPEVEMEVVKGKDKEKIVETVNLEDIIDVKGWKALGNRLSQYKVTKVSLTEEQEDTGLEEGDDENELIEATETGKDSQSSKKKEESSWEPEPPVGEDGQAALFAPPEKPKHQVQKASPPKPKVKVEQANLFGESKSQKPSQKEAVENEKVKPASKNNDDKAFGVGETIEFEI
jgi:topoisomerase-4 subunit A